MLSVLSSQDGHYKARCERGAAKRVTDQKDLGATKVMTARLVNLILQKMCTHRFSWPHSGVDGQDYQVCLICGVAYEYDLVTMRRVRRLESPPTSENDSKGSPGMTAS